MKKIIMIAVLGLMPLNTFAEKEVKNSLGSIVYSKFPFDTKEAKTRQKETAKDLDIPVETVIDLGGGTTLTMVLIPSGEFIMGNTRERSRHAPVRKVRLTRPFYIGKYEITQQQWNVLMGSNPSETQKNDNPVEYIAWYDCWEFIQKVSEKEKKCFRLPTEAEWEYCCRAGTPSRFYFGSDESRLEEYAWYGKNSRWKSHPVGQKKPNAWGLFDMYGNVSEHCFDWFVVYSTQLVTDPFGPVSGKYRVSRGGSISARPSYFSSYFRGRSMPDVRFSSDGFRIVMEIGTKNIPTEKSHTEKKDTAYYHAQAINGLMKIVAVQRNWRRKDADSNGANDYWTLDVCGLRYITDTKIKPCLVKYLDSGIANADASPRMKNLTPKPFNGYFYKALVKDSTGKTYNRKSSKHAYRGLCTNPHDYAFCAFPAEYGKTGTHTFLITKYGVIYKKDIKGKPVEELPSDDPCMQGWKITERDETKMLYWKVIKRMVELRKPPKSSK